MRLPFQYDDDVNKGPFAAETGDEKVFVKYGYDGTGDQSGMYGTFIIFLFIVFLFIHVFLHKAREDPSPPSLFLFQKKVAVCLYFMLTIVLFQCGTINLHSKDELPSAERQAVGPRLWAGDIMLRALERGRLISPRIRNLRCGRLQRRPHR